MKDYIRRALKFIAYLVAIFAIVLILVPLITGQKPDLNYQDLLHERKFVILFVAFIIYSFLYPVIAFTNIKRHLNGSYADNREIFESAFEAMQYVKTVDTPEKIVYRKKSGFSRFAQWWEDAVTVFPNENPVIISGLRKAVTRIDRIIDMKLSEKSNQ